LIFSSGLPPCHPLSRTVVGYTVWQFRSGVLGLTADVSAVPARPFIFSSGLPPCHPLSRTAVGYTVWQFRSGVLGLTADVSAVPAHPPVYFFLQG
jgi:hypothetical protein